MTVKISTPEFLVAASCALLCTGNTTSGVVFACLGVLGAISRVIIENSVRLENTKRDQETYNTIRRTGDTIASAISSLIVSHRDDSDYN